MGCHLSVPPQPRHWNCARTSILTPDIIVYCIWMRFRNFDHVLVAFVVPLPYMSFPWVTKPCVILAHSKAHIQGKPLWRHQMETFSALLAICAGNLPVPGEFPEQRPVTRSFDVFFDLRLNKLLSKQSWGWWFETLSNSLWRHRNVKIKTWPRSLVQCEGSMLVDLTTEECKPNAIFLQERWLPGGHYHS